MKNNHSVYTLLIIYIFVDTIFFMKLNFNSLTYFPFLTNGSKLLSKNAKRKTLGHDSTSLNQGPGLFPRWRPSFHTALSDSYLNETWRHFGLRACLETTTGLL